MISVLIGMIIGLIFYYLRNGKKKVKEEEKKQKMEFRVIGKTGDGRGIGVSYGGVYIFNEKEHWWDRLEDTDL